VNEAIRVSWTRALATVVGAEPLFELFDEMEVAKLQLELSYTSPLGGGGIMSYAEAGELSTRESFVILDVLADRREAEADLSVRPFEYVVKSIAKMFGGR